MAKIPSILYVRAMKDSAGKNYLVAADDIKGLGIGIGDKDKVGVYRLASTLEVRGVIETTETVAD